MRCEFEIYLSEQKRIKSEIGDYILSMNASTFDAESRLKVDYALGRITHNIADSSDIRELLITNLIYCVFGISFISSYSKTNLTKVKSFKYQYNIILASIKKFCTADFHSFSKAIFDFYLSLYYRESNEILSVSKIISSLDGFKDNAAYLNATYLSVGRTLYQFGRISDSLEYFERYIDTLDANADSSNIYIAYSNLIEGLLLVRNFEKSRLYLEQFKQLKFGTEHFVSRYKPRIKWLSALITYYRSPTTNMFAITDLVRKRTPYYQFRFIIHLYFLSVYRGEFKVMNIDSFRKHIRRKSLELGGIGRHENMQLKVVSLINDFIEYDDIDCILEAIDYVKNLQDPHIRMLSMVTIASILIRRGRYGEAEMAFDEYRNFCFKAKSNDGDILRMGYPLKKTLDNYWRLNG